MRGERDPLATIMVFITIMCISLCIVGGVSGSLNGPDPLKTGTGTLITTTRINTDQENPVIFQDKIAWQGRDPDYFTFDIILYNCTSGEELLITSGTPDTDQLSPSIFGDIIVWVDGRNGFFDIYLYNCRNQELTLVTRNTKDTNQANPALHDNRIVWQDTRHGLWDIYCYDLASGNETRITDGTADNQFPDISGSWIVWQTMDPVNMTSDVVAYNIDTGMTRLLSPDTQQSNQEFPDIWDDTVVWQGMDVINGTYDVYLCNITSGVIQQLTPDTPTSDQQYPRIENDLVVWQDNRNGVYNIFIHDLATGTSSMLTNGTADQTKPAVSGNRVVWQDDRSGVRQIYLLTSGDSSTCPVADFTANTTSGVLPFSVSFTSQSTGEPTHWIWDFGDGTRLEGQNVTHVYTNPGIYSVTLTVNTPYCRDSKRVEQLITAGSAPLAQFSLDPTEGVAPLVVQCTDESSGEPTAWSWDFGDGTNSTDQHPVHEFAPGTFTIRLNVTNQFGSSALEKTGILMVVNGTREEISWNIPGIDVLDEDGGQRIVVNITEAPVTFFNETLLEVSGPVQGNLQSLRFFSGNTSLFVASTNTTVAGNISGMAVTSRPVGPAGEVLIDLTMPYSNPDASIQSIVWENITPLDLEAAKQAWFTVTYGDVTGGAYTVQFLKKGINQTGPAKIRMAVNSSWVKTQETLYDRTEIQSDPAGASVYVDGIYRGDTPISIAGPSAGTHQLVVAKTGYVDIEQTIFLGGIGIIRIGDDGTSEFLPTRYLYSDPVTNTDYFEADSPGGLSKFTLAGLSYAGNPFQLFTLFWTSHFGNTGSSASSGGGSSASIGGGSVATLTTATVPQSPVATPVDTPVSTSVREVVTESITPVSRTSPGVPETPEAPQAGDTVPPSDPNYGKTPLGVISGMIAWVGELTRGRFIFIFAAIAITVVSVIAIWKRGYIGRE